MQGQLRNERLRFEIVTECGHCQEAIDIRMDSELNYHVQDQGAEPMIYMPLVDFDELDDPSIIDAF